MPAAAAPTAAYTMASASAAEPLCLGGLLRRVQSMRDTQLDLSEKKAKRGLSILITGGNGVGKTELLDALVECCKLSREPSDSTLRAAMAAPDRALISALPGVGTADERMHLLLHSGLNTVPSWVLPFKMLSGGESARIMTALQLTQGCTAFDNFGCCPDEQSANMAALAASRLLPPGKLVVFATHTPRLAQFLQPDHVIWILEQSADSPPAENRYILINNPNGTECGRPDVSVQLVPPVDASGPFDKEPPYQPYIGIRGGGSPATAGPPHVMTAAVTRTAFTALVTLRTSLEFNGTVKKRFFQLPAEFSTPWRLACMVGPSGSGKSVAISRLSNLSSLPEAVWDGSSVIDVLGGSSELVRSRAAAVGLSSERWSRRLGQLSSGQQAAARMAYALQPFDTDEDCTVAIDEAFSWHDVDSAAACAHTLHAFVQARGGKIKLVLAGAAINHPLLAILQPDWVFNPSKPAYRSLHIFTEPADQPNFVAPRSVVPFAEVLFRRYAFSGMARKCHSDKAHQHWDQFKGHHYLSGEMPKDAFSNLFLLRDDATGQAVGMNAYGVHVGKTSAADPRKYHHSKRLVILPSHQGMGLGSLLSEKVAAYAIIGGDKRYGSVTANAGLAAHRDKSSLWHKNRNSGKQSNAGGAFGAGRAAYTQYSHEYVGPPHAPKFASASAPSSANTGASASAGAAGAASGNARSGAAPAGTSGDGDDEVIIID